MIKKLLLFIFISGLAHADTVVKYGVELPKHGEGYGATKALFLVYQDKWFGPFIYQYEGGTWFDNAGEGRKSSGMINASFGVEVNAGYVFSQALAGPAIISSPDTVLGGPFQFDSDIAIGLKDPKNGNTIGINYTHISSGGLELPNKGRDFILFRVGIPF